MNLTIQPSLKKLIDRRMKSGKYATPQDAVAAAMLNLDQQENFGDFTPGELDALLSEGEQSIRKGGALDGDKAFLRDENGARGQSRDLNEISDFAQGG